MALGAIFASVPNFAGCVSAPPRRSLRTVAGSPPFVVSLPRPSVRAAAQTSVAAAFAGEWILSMLPRARQTVEDAGFRFRTKVAVIAHRDISEFVEATGRTNGRLRAWSTWDHVHLLDRAYWRDSSDGVAIARLTHELVHVGMFQTFASKSHALRAAIPFFFLEGAASVIARQSDARMPLSLLKARNTTLPVRQTGGAEAYGAAHHAGAFLAREFGNGIFADVTRLAASDGAEGAVERALKEKTGLSPASLWQRTLDG